MYISIKTKFAIVLAFSLIWMGFSIWFSQPWYKDLTAQIGLYPAYFFITFIAIVPGFINAFVFMSLLMDKRPKIIEDLKYPPVTVLMAAYNEASVIRSTLNSLFLQNYPAPIRVIVISDGSYDETVDVVRETENKHPNLELIYLHHNCGKAAALNHGLTDTTRAELMLNRDRVETQNSLNNGIYYTLGAASVEQKIIERLTAIVMGGDMFFSDTNSRPMVRAKLIYDLLPEYGVTAQLRYRQYWDTNTSLPNNYFNPSQYSETMVAFGMRKRIEGWVLSGTAGVGRQSVNQEANTTTQLYEFAATSPVNSNDYYFKTRMGYGKSAGFQGPNYFYRYIMEELIIPF